MFFNPHSALWLLPLRIRPSGGKGGGGNVGTPLVSLSWMRDWTFFLFGVEASSYSFLTSKFDFLSLFFFFFIHQMVSVIGVLLQLC